MKGIIDKTCKIYRFITMFRRVSLSTIGLLALLTASFSVTESAFAGFDYTTWWSSGGQTSGYKTETTTTQYSGSTYTTGVTYDSVSSSSTGFKPFSSSSFPLSVGTGVSFNGSNANNGGSGIGSTTNTGGSFGGTRGDKCTHRSIIAAMFPNNLQCGTFGWVLPGFIWGDCPMVACMLKLNSSYQSPLGSADF
jgi:hypothetical protein